MEQRQTGFKFCIHTTLALTLHPPKVSACLFNYIKVKAKAHLGTIQLSPTLVGETIFWQEMLEMGKCFVQSDHTV